VNPLRSRSLVTTSALNLPVKAVVFTVIAAKGGEILKRNSDALSLRSTHAKLTARF
jgi:hypothetical protein